MERGCSLTERRFSGLPGKPSAKASREVRSGAPLLSLARITLLLGGFFSAACKHCHESNDHN